MIWSALLSLLSSVTDAGPAGAVAGLLLITVLAAVAVLTRDAAPAAPPVTRRLLRQRAARSGVPRHRDPDAPGRTRPRGPTRPLAAG